jgi:diketogulonate reductase-like aldo/keto reductase
MFYRRDFIKYSLLGISNIFFSNKLFALNQKKIIKKIIPKSNESISPIGMGTWLTFDVMPTKKNVYDRSLILKSFFENHGQMIDSSPMYGMAEKIIGMSLKNLENKNKLFSATKIWTPAEFYGEKQIINSFKLWKISKFSLIQVHNLLNYKSHSETLTKYKKDGKIKYLGITTSHGSRHDELINIMKKDNIDFVQFTYNILDDEAEKYILPLAYEKNIAVIINRPFQGGKLFEYTKNLKIPSWIQNYDLNSWSEIYLKFIISHPFVTCAIPATSQLKHMKENMQSQYGNLLNEDQRAEIKKFFKKLI